MKDHHSCISQMGQSHACSIACEDLSLPEAGPGNNMPYEADPKDKLSIVLRLSLKGAKPMCLHKDVLNQWLRWKHPEHLLSFIDLCSTSLLRFPCSHYSQVMKIMCSASLFNTSLKIWMSVSYSGFRAACLVHLISEDLERKVKIQPFSFKGKKYSPYFFVQYIPTLRRWDFPQGGQGEGAQRNSGQQPLSKLNKPSCNDMAEI